MSIRCYGVARLTKDPELQMTQSGVEVVKFTIASNRDFKNANGEYDADFINCIAWRHQARYINNYIKKGNQVFVEGHWQTDKYEKDGRTVYKNDFVVEQVKLLEKREKPSEQAYGSEGATYAPTNNMNDLDLDKELPF